MNTNNIKGRWIANENTRFDAPVAHPRNPQVLSRPASVSLNRSEWTGVLVVLVAALAFFVGSFAYEVAMRPDRESLRAGPFESIEHYIAAREEARDTLSEREYQAWQDVNPTPTFPKRTRNQRELAEIVSYMDTFRNEDGTYITVEEWVERGRQEDAERAERTQAARKRANDAYARWKEQQTTPSSQRW